MWPFKKECPTCEHYVTLWERDRYKTNEYKALLFHHWQAHGKQTKGMQRMARKIKRQKAEIERLRKCINGELR